MVRMEEKEYGEELNFPPHCSLVSERPRMEDGWREAVVSGGEHLKRVLDEYVELDFECLLQELDSPYIEECTECLKTEGERIFRVFVRPRQFDQP